MSRTLPLEPGYCYHIYNRGNNRENLFREEDNYRYFLDRYFHYLSPVVDTFAYCLLKNHFHLLIRVKAPSDLRGFPNLEGLTGTNTSRQFSTFSIHIPRRSINGMAGPAIFFKNVSVEK